MCFDIISLPSDCCSIIFPDFFLPTTYPSYYFMYPFIHQIFHAFILCTRYFLEAEEPLANMIEVIFSQEGYIHMQKNRQRSSNR